MFDSLDVLGLIVTDDNHMIGKGESFYQVKKIMTH